MKIFNRGTDTKAAAPAAPATLAAPVPAPAAAPVSAPSAAPVAVAPAEPAAPPAPDLAVILDANVKEMSEKIARLASTLESTSQERGSFEAKLEQMEERMRKLSSLTEMISAQYNPFVGDAPQERDPLPSAEVGLAAPPMPSSSLAGLPAPPPPGPTLGLTLEPPPAAPAPEPFGALPAFDAPPAPPMDVPALVEPAPAPAAAPAPEQPAPEPGVYLWSIPAGFESSMLLLGWADMLLKTAGSREALLDIVNYYHNIGWIGDPARDQILAYADGLTTPLAGAEGDWRASVETHEKSLLFVEKLRAVAGRRG